jgi:DNA recombination protein RmuC
MDLTLFLLIVVFFSQIIILLIFLTKKDNKTQETYNLLDKFQNSLLQRINENHLMSNNQFENHNKNTNQSIKSLQDNVLQKLNLIKDDNNKQLQEIRKTVDEKLQSTLEKKLTQSFKQVSDRLEAVHQGLGDMQTLATGVGDLQKVLANVKTRGILGEHQLENILEQILTPSQYIRDVITKKGSREHVEFAIKLPGKNENEEVLIPVDSKFPLSDYERLQDAEQQANKTEIEKCQLKLTKTIISFAKDVSTKYIDPPNTTNFAIIFLPIEGLYAQVLKNPGLFETLQRDYNVTITGPTTLSALLNSLQMGYRTLAIQKKSSQVWKILSAVKTEFNTFSEYLATVHKQIDTASYSLQKLRDTRTNVMNKKLENVLDMDKNEAIKILEGK